MMAGIVILPVMKMEGSYGWLFSRICAAHADIPGHEVNTDEQAGHDAQQARCLIGLTRGPHKEKRVIHETTHWKTFQPLYETAKRAVY